MTKRLLTPTEIKKADELYNMYKDNKREFVERYGKDAEKVMRGRAIKNVKTKTENMHKDKIKEMVKSALQTPSSINAKEYLSKRDKNLKEAFNPTDVVTMDIPLFIRMMEYAREDAKSDMDLHDVAEKATQTSANGKTLTMSDYTNLVGEKINEDDWMQSDDESDMAHSQLISIKSNADKLMNVIDPNEQLDAWVQSKLTKAQDYLQSVYDYLNGEETVEEGLPKGFWAKKIPGGKMKEAMYGDSDGDYEHDKRVEKEAIHLYDKGEELFLQGATEEAEELRQQALDASSWLGWGETELPPYTMRNSTGTMDESYKALVNKLKGQGKSEKAAKAIAGAVAAYKAKGGGKGPTAKQVEENKDSLDLIKHYREEIARLEKIEKAYNKRLESGDYYSESDMKRYRDMAVTDRKKAEDEIKKLTHLEEAELDEKHLTPAEKAKKEDIVKAMKKTFKGPKPALYAIATEKAKKVAEESLAEKIMSKLKGKSELNEYDEIELDDDDYLDYGGDDSYKNQMKQRYHGDNFPNEEIRNKEIKTHDASVEEFITDNGNTLSIDKLINWLGY